MQRPWCQQCLSGRLPCSGYESNLLWVNTLNASHPNQKQAASRETPTLCGRARGETMHAEDARTDQATAHLTLSRTDHPTLTAREQLYFGHFWANFMPSYCKTFSTAAADLTSVGWMTLVGQMYGNDRLLRSIVMRLAMAGLTVETDDVQLRTKALQSYNTTTHAIAAALQRQKDYKKDEVLLAIRLMTLFEVGGSCCLEQVIFAARNSPRVFVWREHGQGQQALFLARGPHALTSHHVQGFPLPRPLSDRDFASLHLWQVYWFTRMVVCSIQAFVGEGDEIKAADEKRELYASKSSHSLPLLFHYQGGMAQNATALLCLGIAIRYFVTLELEDQKGRESQVLEEVLEKKVCGVYVKQVITSMFGGKDPCLRKKPGDARATDRISWF